MPGRSWCAISPRTRSQRSRYRPFAATCKPITAEELKAAVDNNTLGLPGGFETAGQLAGAYTNIVQYGLPDDYFQHRIDVTRHHADAVRIMAGQVGVDQMVGSQSRFGRIRAGGEEEIDDPVVKGVGMDGKVSHWSCRVGRGGAGAA